MTCVTPPCRRLPFRRYASLSILRLVWHRLAALLAYLVMLGAFFLFGVPSANAGAGPHVIDDAGVETPGLCHVETRTTWGRHNKGLVNASPACTFHSLPRLEIGAGLTAERADSRWDGAYGPALKLNLGREDSRIDWAVAAEAQVGARSGEFSGAALTMPVSFEVSDTVRLNANLAWSHDPSADRRNAAFHGAQIEYDLRPDLMLMAEAYQRYWETLGVQAGLRWTPDQGPLDFDVLIGLPDGGRETQVTLGLTFRGAPFQRR